MGLGKRYTPALKQATRSVCAGERVRVTGLFLPLFSFPFSPQPTSIKLPLPLREFKIKSPTDSSVGLLSSFSRLRKVKFRIRQLIYE
ncbi:hypothetical protein FDUTEX481_03082 [Tolypothrix sp. PCC 7601]|nr:hypothetical protein FDUTEX481_03082 [Tolypothrix sp. PCC 7601]